MVGFKASACLDLPDSFPCMFQVRIVYKRLLQEIWGVEVKEL